MFQNTLLLAIGLAVLSAGLTLSGTGSVVLAFGAYVFTGMAVLMATLVAELLLIDAESKQSSESSMVPVGSQG